MASKNFDDVKTTRSVASAFNQAFDDTPQPEPEKEKAEAGKRINLALTPENYQFIWVMSKYKKQTMTKFINSVFADYRTQIQEENPELYNLTKLLFQAENAE